MVGNDFFGGGYEIIGASQLLQRSPPPPPRVGPLSAATTNHGDNSLAGLLSGDRPPRAPCNAGRSSHHKGSRAPVLPPCNEPAVLSTWSEPVDVTSTSHEDPGTVEHSAWEWELSGESRDATGAERGVQRDTASTFEGKNVLCGDSGGPALCRGKRHTTEFCAKRMEFWRSCQRTCGACRAPAPPLSPFPPPPPTPNRFPPSHKFPLFTPRGVSSTASRAEPTRFHATAAAPGDLGWADDASEGLNPDKTGWDDELLLGWDPAGMGSEVAPPANPPISPQRPPQSPPAPSPPPPPSPSPDSPPAWPPVITLIGLVSGEAAIPGPRKPEASTSMQWHEELTLPRALPGDGGGAAGNGAAAALQPSRAAAGKPQFGEQVGMGQSVRGCYLRSCDNLSLQSWLLGSRWSPAIIVLVSGILLIASRAASLCIKQHKRSLKKRSRRGQLLDGGGSRGRPKYQRAPPLPSQHQNESNTPLDEFNGGSEGAYEAEEAGQELTPSGILGRGPTSAIGKLPGHATRQQRLPVAPEATNAHRLHGVWMDPSERPRSCSEWQMESSPRKWAN